MGAGSATFKDANDGGKPRRVGSNPEHHALRVSRDLPFGEGAALALCRDQCLELLVDAGPCVVQDDQLIASAPDAESSIGQRSPACQPCSTISRAQGARDRQLLESWPRAVAISTCSQT